MGQRAGYVSAFYFDDESLEIFTQAEFEKQIAYN